MRRLSVLTMLLLSTAAPAAAAEPFGVASAGARSQAMGGAFVSLADDASALFSNPAGLVLSGAPCVWGDYAEPRGVGSRGEGRLGAVLPRGATVFGVSGYRHALDGRTRNILVAGVARNLVEGTQGSFLAVGVTFKIGRLLADRECSVCPGREADTHPSGDIGLVIRPLPFVSFGYAVETVVESDFDAGEARESWERAGRLGMAWLWEEKVTIAVERESRGGETTIRYGVAVRASWGIELMGGVIGKSRVAGGVRWSANRLRLGAAFEQANEDVSGRVTVELFPTGRKEGFGG